MIVLPFHVKKNLQNLSSNSNQRVILFLTSGGEKISEFNLSLITIDSEGMGIPDTEFTSICTMPSGEFARICK